MEGLKKSLEEAQKQQTDMHHTEQPSMIFIYAL